VPLSQLKETEIEDDFKKKNVDEFSGKTLETFFVTTDYGCKRQDVVKFEQGEETLLGLSVPYLYYMGFKVENEEEEEQKEEKAVESSTIILRKPMKDFVGLENVEESIKKAILNFSHFLSVGNMDEAYNSVRNIKNNTVW
jgi:intraflagellar transport protein 140